MPSSSIDWPAQARADLRAAIREALSNLLETKHLYQTVTVDVSTAKQRTTGRNISDGNKAMFEQELKRRIETAWEPAEPELPGVARQQKTAPERIYVVFPTIKTFCARCDDVEAHNVVYAHDITSDLVTRAGGYHQGPSQHLAAAYRCQVCKVTLQYFLIKREAIKLSLVGRSPIEHVSVPDVIPKSHCKYYSGAVVAFQSGQVLPALFMLRVFIEQFALSQVADKTLRADVALETYMAALPAPVRGHFPSPRDLYGKLSEAIHAAREDAELFNDVLEKLMEHFEARRLYKVTTA